MSDSPSGLSRDAARSRAMNHFQQAEKRDALVKAELDKERIATAAKTVKLRALRMAREAEEQAAAEKLAAEKAAMPKATRVKRVKKVAAGA